MSYGTIMGPLIIMATQPFIKNLYPPEAFGVLELYTNFINILLVIFTLKYEIAIINEKTNRIVHSIIQSIFIFSTFLIFILIVCIYFSSDFIISYFRIPIKYNYIIYLAPLSAYILAIARTLYYYLIRNNLFNHTSIYKINRRAIEAIGQIRFGKVFNNYGLFIGELIGNIISTITMVIVLRKKLFKIKLEKIRYYFNILKNNRNIILYLFPSDMLNILMNSFLVLLFVKNFGFKMTGYLEFSLKILLIPTAILGTIIGPLVLQYVSRAIEKNKSFYKKIYYLSTLTAFGGIVFSILLLFFGDDLIKIFFNQEWAQSILYYKILLFPTIIQLIVSPLGQILIALREYKTDAYIKIIKFVIFGSLFLFQHHSPISLLKIFSFISVIFYLIYLGIILHRTRKYHSIIA